MFCLVLCDSSQSYDEFLDFSVYIHHKIIQTLAIKMFKIKNCLPLEIASYIFLT